jgi:hypothetical protein
VRVEAETGTKGRTVLGAVLGIGGGTLAYVGALMFLVGSFDATLEDDGEPRDLTEDEASGLRVTGGVLFLGGATAGIVGLVMLVDNDTKVRLSAPASGPRTAGRRSSDALSLKLPLGLAVTERGLVF